MKIIKLIICILFGIMFINAGLDKFFHYNPVPQLTETQMKLYAAFGEIGWLLPLVGVVEIIGGLLFIFPKTRALGAIIILPVLTGILIHNVYRDPSTTGICISGILFLINIWILIDNREKYKNLVG
ncbi:MULTISPECIES: MauE/DoxX family redox-associated membrane protein [Chryseobacterium]|uniref:DoxX family protein n=1 Tax=Chryseobacterium pennae TaxID=2258962 RepID=A0A3D9CBI9_9FLAO|nr:MULTISPECIES: MauE/DoxX family redox-associated membrane protein [Chryseobacterium]MCS4303618.1 putative membrane protein YphA (DoxX/SURF4 family) [Chryseobacterium sp. BIGb0232]REC63233.1 DoxX family protein [Chryseobacterium pennae]ROS10317.1 DoxX-like protein [Chryseobacterium nakagawai]